MTRLKKINIPMVFILSPSETLTQKKLSSGQQGNRLLSGAEGGLSEQSVWGALPGSRVKVREVHLITGLGSALQLGVFIALSLECQGAADSLG